MSYSTARETAVLTWAVKCRATRAIHLRMLHKRHEVLCGIMRKRFGRRVAALMPPLDVSNPGDVYTSRQVEPVPETCRGLTYGATALLLGVLYLSFVGK
jgi:hypothetical protein